MSQKDVMQIKIDGNAVGIIGLKHVMEEMAQGWAELSDQAVQDELLKRLSRKNYMPDKAKASYARAFLREFKRFLGKPFDEEVSEVPEIKVLGPGCFQCKGLERELMEVIAELDLVADVEHVTDLKEIGRYGVMGTPALVINNTVRSVGSVPPRNKLIEWLKETRK